MSTTIDHPLSYGRAPTGFEAAAAGAAPAAAGPDAMIGPVAGGRLHVMSFNIRFDRDGTLPGDPDHWPARRPLLRELLALEQPTVLGVQEALHHQLDAVAEGLGPAYGRVGYGRDGGSLGEYSAIFYDSRRLVLMEWDQAWLSDTPDEAGSATWGNDVPRILVWARFRDLLTGTVFVQINTHFDHESESARVQGAQAIVALAGRFAGLPVVVTGDFNAVAGDSRAYTELTRPGAFADTWVSSRRCASRAWGTFPGYVDPLDGGGRIDWILTSPGLQVHQAGINVWTKGGRYPSDHAPVQAVISL